MGGSQQDPWMNPLLLLVRRCSFGKLGNQAHEGAVELVGLDLDWRRWTRGCTTGNDENVKVSTSANEFLVQGQVTLREC